MNILLSLEKQEDRLEEIAKNFLTFGDLTFHKYADQIDAVTSADIQRAAGRALSTKPTMIVTGGAINLVPTITEVSRQLQ
jgi:predicted Zn-dependent peptidase